MVDFQTLWSYKPAIWSVSVFFISLYLLLSLRKWMRLYLMCQRLPSPAQHPIVGHAKEYLSKHRFFYYVMKWRESFPHFHNTNILCFPLIVVQSPEMVQTILSRKKHSEKGVIYNSLLPLLGEGLVTSKGEKWSAHRKMITPTFHFNILGKFVEVFVEKTNEFMDRLKEVDKEDFIEISLYTHKLTLDMICETAMGTSVNALKDEGRQLKIVEAMHNLEAFGIHRIVRPWLLLDILYRFTKLKKAENHNKEVLHNFTIKMIQERREALRQQKLSATTEELQKKKPIFMDMLIENSDSGNFLSDAEIRDEVNTFIFAGQNTTQLAINYGLFLIGQNPDILEKIILELKEIFGNDERNPSMDDLRRMNYLEMCIKESLRLFPSIPVIGRRLTEDEIIGKHVLPAGADVLIMPYALHRDPKQFPNPEKFDPDNFLPERIRDRHPYAYIPFSAGPRNCMGSKFATYAVKTVLSSIFRKYRVESKIKQEDMKTVPCLVLVPKTGIRLRFIPRTD